MARFGHAIWTHEGKNYAANGNVVVSLADAPPKTELLGVLVRLKCDIVQAAGAVAIAGDQLFRIFAGIYIDGEVGVTPVVNATGRALHFLRWHMMGKQLSQPADIPAAGAGSYSRVMEVWIPFEDFFSANPGDSAIPAELFRSTPLRINFGDPAALFGANTSIANATLRIHSFYRPWSPGSLPAVPYIKFEDWNQQSIVLGGKKAYTHLLAYSESADLTDANYTTLTLYADGRTIKPNLQLGEYAAEYNLMRSEGASIQTRGLVHTGPAAAAAPAAGGENLLDMPLTPTVGGTQAITLPWAPLLSPPDRYKLTQVVHPDQHIRLDFTGAATLLRVLYRCICESDHGAVVQMGNKLGISNPESRKVTSRNMKRGGSVAARQALILPKRFVMTPAEILANGGETSIV